MDCMTTGQGDGHMGSTNSFYLCPVEVYIATVRLSGTLPQNDMGLQRKNTGNCVELYSEAPHPYSPS